MDLFRLFLLALGLFQHILRPGLWLSAALRSALLLLFLVDLLLFGCPFGLDILRNQLFHFLIVQTVKIYRIDTGVHRSGFPDNADFLHRDLLARRSLRRFRFRLLFFLFGFIKRKIFCLILLRIVFKNNVQFILGQGAHMIFC